MRISDWSSDVCSSDLPDLDRFERPVLAIGIHAQRDRGASAEPRQQEILGRGSQILPAQPRPLVADQRVAADLDLGAKMILADAGGSMGHQIVLPWRSRRTEDRRVGKKCVRTCR